MTNTLDKSSMQEQTTVSEPTKIEIKPEDILGTFNLKVDVKKSEPACMHCMPSRPLKDHKSLNGILIHERIDCPECIIYMVNEDKLYEK